MAKNLLGLENTLDVMTGANGLRWYGCVLRGGDVLDFKMVGRGSGRPKMTCGMQVEEHIGLKKRKVPQTELSSVRELPRNKR